VPAERAAAFAPGRVNLIGEHTDYNHGLALPFAIAAGVTVRAVALESPGPARVRAHAVDLSESDDFPLEDPGPAEGWRAFVRGVVAECGRAGYPLAAAGLQIGGDVPLGAGLSSSAALEVSLCLALLELGRRAAAQASTAAAGRGAPDRVEIAQLCSRVENDWVGARTGLMDQLASLFGARESALRIDFRSLDIEPIPLRLGDWRLAILDSGERHVHASSGYNERRAECARACELLGVESLREAREEDLGTLPEPLRSRAAHVLGENARVEQAVAALAADDLGALGALLDASHASQRDLFDVSTPAVERTVLQLRRSGAAGARLMGGGFGGGVLGLFGPGFEPPAGTLEVHPGPGAHLLD
jgi:galactokinase